MVVGVLGVAAVALGGAQAAVTKLPTKPIIAAVSGFDRVWSGSTWTLVPHATVVGHYSKLPTKTIIAPRAGFSRVWNGYSWSLVPSATVAGYSKTPTAPIIAAKSGYSRVWNGYQWTLVPLGKISTLAATGLGGRVAGVNDHPIWMGSSQDVAARLIVGSHAGAVRIDAPWNVLEPARGSYDSMRLGLLDAYVNRMSQAGIDVLMVVTSSPSWASGSTDIHMPPLNNADYANFVGFLVQRYAGKVHEFEIWNEPNGGWAWTHPDPVRYAGLLKAAYTKVKSIDPSVVVLAPSLSGPDQASFLDKFYAQGTKGYFDAFSMHGYWWNLNGSKVLPYWDAANPGASIFGAFNAKILPVMAKYGDQAKPVWWTETGIATSGSITTAADEASKVTEAFAAWRAGVVPTMSRLYWYDMFDSIGSGTEQNFGLVDLTGSSATLPAAGDFVAKPAYAAFQKQALG